MQRILVLSAEDYQFEARDGGKVQVRRLTYTDGRDQSNDRGRGCVPMTINATPDCLSQLREVPGVYDTVLNPVQRGKNVTLEAQACSFVAPVKLSDLITASKA